MVKFYKLRYSFLLLVVLSLMNFCGCDKKTADIEYTWGESVDELIYKLNQREIEYYLDEDDKKATVIIEYKDFKPESYFNERVYYFAKRIVEDDKENKYPNGALVLIGNNIQTENMDEEKVKKEIEKVDKEYGESQGEGKWDSLQMYTWEKEDTVVESSFDKSGGTFRITYKLKDSERKNLKASGRARDDNNIDKKMLECEWGEKKGVFINKLQKNNIRYYLSSDDKADIIYVTLDGVGIRDSGEYFTFYFSGGREDGVRLLAVKGESYRIGKEEAQEKIKALMKEYGEPEDEPVKAGDVSGYKWITEKENVETLYEGDMFYISKVNGDFIEK